MKRFFPIALLCAVAHAQVTIGGATSIGGNTIVGVAGDPPPAITFSPTGGTYSSTQTVTVNCPAGHSCFYTTDGSTPDIASTEYVAPITVSASQTINVIAASVGADYQNTERSSTGWKCVNHSGGTSNGVTCDSGGGTGTIQPSAWAWTFGAPMQESLSTTSSTGETQQLYIYTGASCDSCTMLAEDKTIQPTQGSTYIANNEADVSMYDATDQRLHMGGLQCNQQPGIMQWQIDNQQGSWQNTGITFGCPLSTTQPTHIGFTMHWNIGDAGCGGYGCDSYDQLIVSMGGVSHTYALGTTLEAYTEPTWAAYVGNQDQIDLTNTATSGANPTTAGRTVWNNNVTAGYYGTTSNASATYTISSSASVFSATPTTVAEGSVPTSTTAYYQPVTVTNTGTAPLTFSSIGFTGTNASDFAVTGGFAPAVNPVGGNTLPLCSTGAAVAAGASCIVPVDFKPGSSSARSASLSFSDNAPGSPHTVALTGTGMAASGTPLPACGSMLAANTTYYATADITCNNSGYGLNGTGITVNLNGHALSVGAAPSVAQAATWGFYAATSDDPSFNLTPCSFSGKSAVCGQGITPTTTAAGNITIENGTINVASGATSAGTMQYGSAAIYTGYNSGSNWELHDLTINIPLNCTSCQALTGASGGMYNGAGYRFYKNNISDLSGFVNSRCEYEGAAVSFSNNTSPSPGPIAYENVIDHSPQDGFVAATMYGYYFGNTIKIGNPNGTSAGTSSTCSGIGSASTGTMAANDFGIEAANSHQWIANNTMTNYEGRGIDMSAPLGALTDIHTAGNTITTTDLPNYVEYQGGANPGCALGGSYGIRLNVFGTTSTNFTNSGDATVVTATNCDAVGFSVSSSNSTTNSISNGNYTAKLGAGASNVNAYGFVQGSQDYVTGTPAMLYTTGNTYTGDTVDVAIGKADTGFAGPWTDTNSTYVKPATASQGFCGLAGTPRLNSWVVFSACFSNPGASPTIGPVYVRNPTWVGGAAENSNDFAQATALDDAGTTASYYIQYLYTVTVEKSSNSAPISGATVAITDSHSGSECSATTNSSGVASCWLNENEYSFTAPNAPATTNFSPMAATITASGCTTDNYSFSVGTSNITETRTLAGC